MHEYPIYFETKDYIVKYTKECKMYTKDEPSFMAVGVKIGEWVIQNENTTVKSDIIRWMTEKYYNYLCENNVGVVIY